MCHVQRQQFFQLREEPAPFCSVMPVALKLGDHLTLASDMLFAADDVPFGLVQMCLPHRAIHSPSIAQSKGAVAFRL